MFQQFYQPHPALIDFVNNFMIHEEKFNCAEPRPTFSFPPLPEHSLFFYIRDRMDVEYTSLQKKVKHSRCIIVGPQIVGKKIILGHHHLVIKVGFQPGGLYRFLGIPMQELLGLEATDASDLLGNGINLVIEQLEETESFPKMIAIIENYLLYHVGSLKQSLPIDAVLRLMIKEGGLINIDRLASDACLSIRQFERVCQQRIGQTPKFFSRLVRFARAWTMKEKQPTISWIKIAHECGYYDQMHLIRDFKEFTGVNPSLIESEFLQWKVKFNNQLFW